MRLSNRYAAKISPILIMAAVALAILLPAVPLLGAETYPGEYRGTVLRVVDSDTVKAQIAVWPTLDTIVSVRLRGVDTPEKFRPKCESEKAAAEIATDFVKGLLPAGAEVTITDVTSDKFGGRVVGDLLIDGKSLSEILIEKGFARPYDGGTKSSWCEPETSPERAEG